MDIKFKRNVYFVVGLLLVTLVKITIIIPNVNILFAIYCFYKAYILNEQLKGEKGVKLIKSNNDDEKD